jgi:hypothetical protein
MRRQPHRRRCRKHTAATAIKVQANSQNGRTAPQIARLEVNQHYKVSSRRFSFHFRDPLVEIISPVVLAQHAQSR